MSNYGIAIIDDKDFDNARIKTRDVQVGKQERLTIRVTNIGHTATSFCLNLSVVIEIIPIHSVWKVNRQGWAACTHTWQRICWCVF